MSSTCLSMWELQSLPMFSPTTPFSKRKFSSLVSSDTVLKKFSGAAVHSPNSRDWNERYGIPVYVSLLPYLEVQHSAKHVKVGRLEPDKSQ